MLRQRCPKRMGGVRRSMRKTCDVDITTEDLLEHYYLSVLWRSLAFDLNVALLKVARCACCMLLITQLYEHFTTLLLRPYCLLKYWARHFVFLLIRFIHCLKLPMAAVIAFILAELRFAISKLFIASYCRKLSWVIALTTMSRSGESCAMKTTAIVALDSGWTCFVIMAFHGWWNFWRRATHMAWKRYQRKICVLYSVLFSMLLIGWHTVFDRRALDWWRFWAMTSCWGATSLVELFRQRRLMLISNSASCSMWLASGLSSVRDCLSSSALMPQSRNGKDWLGGWRESIINVKISCRRRFPVTLFHHHCAAWRQRRQLCFMLRRGCRVSSFISLLCFAAVSLRCVTVCSISCPCASSTAITINRSFDKLLFGFCCWRDCVF